MADSILLVDADANFRRALRVALSLDGIRVGEATSLEDATRAMDEQPWSCAVVDLLLPFAEGPRVVELAARRGIHVVACSAHRELLAQVESTAVVLLEKPFSPDCLLEGLARRLGAPRNAPRQGPLATARTRGDR